MMQIICAVLLAGALMFSSSGSPDLTRTAAPEVTNELE